MADPRMIRCDLLTRQNSSERLRASMAISGYMLVNATEFMHSGECSAVSVSCVTDYNQGVGSGIRMNTTGCTCGRGNESYRPKNLFAASTRVCTWSLA